MAIPVVEFQVKNGNFKTRDFSPLIERVLAGVIAIGTKPQFRSNNKQMAHFDANGAIDFFALRMVSFPFYAVIVSAHLWNKFIMVLIKAVKSKKSTSKVKPNYTGSLSPADFSAHCYSIRSNLKKMGPLQFCLPVFLGIHRNPKQISSS